MLNSSVTILLLGTDNGKRIRFQFASGSYIRFQCDSDFL